MKHKDYVAEGKLHQKRVREENRKMLEAGGKLKTLADRMVAEGKAKDVNDAMDRLSIIEPELWHFWAKGQKTYNKKGK